MTRVRIPSQPSRIFQPLSRSPRPPINPDSKGTRPSESKRVWGTAWAKKRWSQCKICLRRDGLGPTTIQVKPTGAIGRKKVTILVPLLFFIITITLFSLSFTLFIFFSSNYSSHTFSFFLVLYILSSSMAFFLSLFFILFSSFSFFWARALVKQAIIKATSAYVFTLPTLAQTPPWYLQPEPKGYFVDMTVTLMIHDSPYVFLSVHIKFISLCIVFKSFIVFLFTVWWTTIA